MDIAGCFSSLKFALQLSRSKVVGVEMGLEGVKVHDKEGMGGLAYAGQDELRLISCGADGQVSFRSCESPAEQILEVTSTAACPQHCLAVSPKGNCFAVGDNDCFVKVTASLWEKLCISSAPGQHFAYVWAPGAASCYIRIVPGIWRACCPGVHLPGGQLRERGHSFQFACARAGLQQQRHDPGRRGRR